MAKCLEDVKTPFLKHKILINNFATIPEGCYAPEELDKLTPDIDLNDYTPLPDITVEEEDTASIIYTSGTTGFSKGVELTHKNLVWDARQCRTIQHVDESDRFLSILPMAHTYENTLGLLLPLMFGSQVFYLDRVPTPNFWFRPCKRFILRLSYPYRLLSRRYTRLKSFPNSTVTESFEPYTVFP